MFLEESWGVTPIAPFFTEALIDKRLGVVADFLAYLLGTNWGVDVIENTSKVSGDLIPADGSRAR